MRTRIELFGWTADSFSHGTLQQGSGIEPDAIDLTDVPLGTPITVGATHAASGVRYDLTVSFGTDALTVSSVTW